MGGVTENRISLTLNTGCQGGVKVVGLSNYLECSVKEVRGCVQTTKSEKEGAQNSSVVSCPQSSLLTSLHNNSQQLKIEGKVNSD